MDLTEFPSVFRKNSSTHKSTRLQDISSGSSENDYDARIAALEKQFAPFDHGLLINFENQMSRLLDEYDELLFHFDCLTIWKTTTLPEVTPDTYDVTITGNGYGVNSRGATTHRRHNNIRKVRPLPYSLAILPNKFSHQMLQSQYVAEDDTSPEVRKILDALEGDLDIFLQQILDQMVAKRSEIHQLVGYIQEYENTLKEHTGPSGDINLPLMAFDYKIVQLTKTVADLTGRVLSHDVIIIDSKEITFGSKSMSTPLPIPSAGVLTLPVTIEGGVRANYWHSSGVKIHNAYWDHYLDTSGPVPTEVGVARYFTPLRKSGLSDAIEWQEQSIPNFYGSAKLVGNISVTQWADILSESSYFYTNWIWMDSNTVAKPADEWDVDPDTTTLSLATPGFPMRTQPCTLSYDSEGVITYTANILKAEGAGDAEILIAYILPDGTLASTITESDVWKLELGFQYEDKITSRCYCNVDITPSVMKIIMSNGAQRFGIGGKVIIPLSKFLAGEARDRFSWNATYKSSAIPNMQSYDIDMCVSHALVYIGVRDGEKWPVTEVIATVPPKIQNLPPIIDNMPNFETQSQFLHLIADVEHLKVSIGTLSDRYERLERSVAEILKQFEPPPDSSPDEIGFWDDIIPSVFNIFISGATAFIPVVGMPLSPLVSVGINTMFQAISQHGIDKLDKATVNSMVQAAVNSMVSTASMWAMSKINNALKPAKPVIPGMKDKDAWMKLDDHISTTMPNMVDKDGKVSWTTNVMSSDITPIPINKSWQKLGDKVESGKANMVEKLIYNQLTKRAKAPVHQYLEMDVRLKGGRERYLTVLGASEGVAGPRLSHFGPVVVNKFSKRANESYVGNVLFKFRDDKLVDAKEVGYTSETLAPLFTLYEKYNKGGSIMGIGDLKKDPNMMYQAAWALYQQRRTHATARPVTNAPLVHPEYLNVVTEALKNLNKDPFQIAGRNCQWALQQVLQVARGASLPRINAGEFGNSWGLCLSGSTMLSSEAYYYYYGGGD